LRDGKPAYEIIVVDGQIYARGPDIPGFSGVADPTAWQNIDVSNLPDDFPFLPYYQALLQPVAIPYSGLNPDQRNRDVTEAGTPTVNGEECRSYRIPDTTETGAAVVVYLSVNAEGLPCSIETNVGGESTTSFYTFDPTISIAAPPGATPIASPVPSR
jgi:hypothetical protein